MTLPTFLHEGDEAPWFEPEAIIVGVVPVELSDGTETEKVMLRFLTDEIGEDSVGAVDALVSTNIAAKLADALPAAVDAAEA